MMDFRHTKTLEKKSILLERRSLLVLSKSARYKWTHGIDGVTVDLINGKEYPRERRVSLTFRNVVLSKINTKD